MSDVCDFCGMGREDEDYHYTHCSNCGDCSGGVEVEYCEDGSHCTVCCTCEEESNA